MEQVVAVSGLILLGIIIPYFFYSLIKDVELRSEK